MHKPNVHSTPNTMAFYALFLITAAALQFAAAARAQTCKTQTFPNNTKFGNCLDLPALKSFLHWTYDAKATARPTLAVAFGAPPEKPDGWVSWGPNPTAEGMAGAQAFVAFKEGGGGAVVVKTYNISSYSSLTEGNISYDIVEKNAMASGELIWIFAKLAAPEWPAAVNYVWQVGPAVRNGGPAKHDFLSENLRAKAKLTLPGNGPSPSPLSPPSSPSPKSGSGGNKSVGARVPAWGVWVYGIVVLLGVMALGF